MSNDIKSIPPLGVSGMSLLGIPLEEWVLMLTLIYTVFLLIDKFPAVLSRLCAGLAWVKGFLNGSRNR